MTPEEALRMPQSQHLAFIRYQNHTIKQAERRLR
jgi:hypothetical protein